MEIISLMINIQFKVSWPAARLHREIRTFDHRKNNCVLNCQLFAGYYLTH